MLKKEFSCRKLIFDTHKFSWQMYLIKTKSTFFLRGIEKKMRKALREVMEIDECQCMQKNAQKLSNMIVHVTKSVHICIYVVR